ncbi:hypothetical protein [Gallaecimonas xiamenensis]|uniref:hypothetical protein n=1 Tax=Gallaecimonas xiamenensis TaxID=1207039 RepID=UPI0012EA2A73|nr:hypothetical protein [Gallaecimonas xiamenensis]
MRIWVLLITLFSPTLAWADTMCKGQVNDLVVSRGGVVLLSGPGDIKSAYICSVVSKNNNVEPEACKVMYSTLLAAKLSDHDVIVTFNPEITDCSAVPSWKWAVGFNWVYITK